MGKENRGGNERNCEFIMWGENWGDKKGPCFREKGKLFWKDSELEEDDRYNIYKVERLRKYYRVPSKYYERG